MAFDWSSGKLALNSMWRRILFISLWNLFSVKNLSRLINIRYRHWRWRWWGRHSTFILWENWSRALWKIVRWRRRWYFRLRRNYTLLWKRRKLRCIWLIVQGHIIRLKTLASSLYISIQRCRDNRVWILILLDSYRLLIWVLDRLFDNTILELPILWNRMMAMLIRNIQWLTLVRKMNYMPI